MRKNKRKMRKQSNKLVGFVIVAIVITLVIFLNTKSKDIKARNASDAKEIAQLQSEIDAEDTRSEELDEYSKYVNTKQFVEDMARDKLGLIYPDEKIFSSED